MIIDVIKECLGMLTSTVSIVVLIIGGSILIYGFKLLCGKLGITVNDGTMVEIITIVSQVIKYLDQKFGNINADDISKEDILSEKNFYLPFKIASIVKKNNTYYGLTNDICDILKRYYPDGVRYSSCYAPTETIGIVSNCYNVVLYKSGIKKIRFVEAFECINNFKNENAEFNSVNIAKLILEMKTNE